MPFSQLSDFSAGQFHIELQLILDAIVEGLCGVDEDGNVTFCNHALLRMTGHQNEDLIRKNLHRALHHKRADGSPYPDEECPLRQAIMARREFHIVADVLWRKDGTCFPAEYWAHPVLHASGPTISVITFQDMTERERATEALRTSEDKFRKILMSVADVAWTSDRNGRTLYISPKVQAVLGYSKQEISAAGSTLRLGLIHPGDFGRVKKNYLALFDQNTPFDEEYRIRRKDGTWIWIHDHATGTHEENGVLYADGAFSDISARKQGEAELQSKTAFLEALANSTIDGILVVGNRDRLLHNQKFVDLFQVAPSLLAEKEDGPMLEYIASLMKDREAFLARIKYLYRHPDETSRDEIELKDGRFFDRYSAAVVDKNGAYHGRIWTFRDITERKQDEQKLRRSQTYLAEAQKLSHIGSWAWKTNQRESVYWSEEHYRIFGLEPGDGIVPFQMSLAGIHPDDLPGFIRTVQQSMAEKKDYEADARIVLPDGSIRSIHGIGHPILDESGELVEFLGLSHDVTERKKNEDMLQQLSMAVEQSPASVLITDPEGRISYVNRKFTEVTGYQPAEVLGMTPQILKSGLTPPETYRALWAAIKQGLEWRGEFCNQKKNGELFWEAVTIRPILDASGAITHFLALKEDITERRRAERELQLTQFSVEHASDSIFWVNPEGRIVYANEGACRSLEHSREELLSLSVADINPLFPKKVWGTFWEDLKREGSMRLETLHKTKHGRTFPIEIMANRVEFDGQEYCFAFVRDISERRRAEEELRSSRQMLQSILDAIPQRVFWKDRNCVYSGCNRPFATDAGLDSPAAIVGKSDFDLAWKDVAELYRADDEQVMNAQAPNLNYHECQIRPDGSELWLQTNKLPLVDLEGNVTGIVGTYDDITERKLAERQLRLTTHSLEIASDGVLWADADARIVYANQAACRNLERSREELLSLSIPDIAPPFSMEDWRAHWQQLKTAGVVNLDATQTSKSGRVFPVEVTANYLEFDGQEYSFAFVRDTSERRELEGQLRQAQKLEGIGQLAAGIAHEINTPTQFVTDNLTFLRDSWKSTHALLEAYRDAIKSSAQTLPADLVAQLEAVEKSCDLDFVVSEVPRAIDQSLDGAHRVAEIVRAMKEFSHPDSVEKTATDLNKGVVSTITVARNEWKYVADVATRLDETLPHVVCYPGDVNQVVLNLVVNAAHAIKEKMHDREKGKITVCTRMRGDFAEITVSDNGTGIPEKIRTRIFDPFFTTKEVGKGTGQGLSLAHAVVVKKHGGKLWFETETDRGTTFFINLPIKPPDREKES